MAPIPNALGAGITDAGLVSAARAGDRTALAELIAFHRPLVLTTCRPVLGSSQLAEDAVQEACLQAMLGLAHLREPQRFGPWLVGIVLNVCRNWLRQPPTDSLSTLALSGASVDLGPGRL